MTNFLFYVGIDPVSVDFLGKQEIRLCFVGVNLALAEPILAKLHDSIQFQSSKGNTAYLRYADIHFLQPPNIGEIILNVDEAEKQEIRGIGYIILKEGKTCILAAATVPTTLPALYCKFKAQ